MHPALALVLVAAGGAVGGVLRQAVRLVADPQPGAWSWATLVVNALGAFALAALLTVLARRPCERTRVLVGTGLLGSLTTFSGLAVEAVSLADAGRPAAAGSYLLVAGVTLVGSAVLGARAAAAAGAR